MQKQPDVREDVYFVLTSIAHVVAATLFGMVLNLSQFPDLLIIAFAISSKAFALFAGENERFFTHLRWAAIPCAAISLVILAFLPPIDWALGAAVLLLYANYPLFLRAREKAPLDILFHGCRYAVIFWMGYGDGITPVAVAGLSVVFLSGIAGELLVGLRTEGKWRTTASGLGITSTVRLVNILVFFLFLLGSFIFSQVVNFPLMIGDVALPIPLFVGFAIAIFISRPVSFGKSKLAPLSVRRREILVIALVAITAIGLPLATRVNLNEQVPSQNYTVSVTMQTIVTGAHPSENQWIVFNYRNSANYYYLLLRTDGILDVSGVVNGTDEPRLVFVQTGLSPFQSHTYVITVDNGVAEFSIDGHEYGMVSVSAGGGEVRVSQYFPRLNVWVVRVTEFQVTPISG